MQAESTAYAEREALAPEPTDHALVAAVRGGDDRAFEQLFARYQRRVAAYVYGMVSDHGRTEDITQEIFISALRRMRETERPIAFRPWIYEIAKNACIDQFRRSRRGEEVSYDAAEDLGAADYGRLAQSGPTPETVVAQKQALHDLQGAFGGLSETHHQILVLREFEGLSYREIGERLGMTRASVESTLFRARRRLTEEYDDLASGQRCVRVQSLLSAAAGGDLGSRDARRLGRHISHCQSCRMQARAAGVDAAAMARRPGRLGALGGKVAGLLPVPMFLRGRRSSGEDLVVHWSALGGPAAEPLLMGWSKAAAAAATLVIASVGAGVGSHVSSQPLRPAGPTPAVERPAAPEPGRASSRPAPRQRTSRAAPSQGGPVLRSESSASEPAKRLGGSAPGTALRPAAKRPKPTGPRKRPATPSVPARPPATSAPNAAPKAPAVGGPVGSGPADQATSVVPTGAAGGGSFNPSAGDRTPSLPAPPPAPPSPAPPGQNDLPPLPSELNGTRGAASDAATGATGAASDAATGATGAVAGVTGKIGVGSGLGETQIDRGL